MTKKLQIIYITILLAILSYTIVISIISKKRIDSNNATVSVSENNDYKILKKNLELEYNLINCKLDNEIVISIKNDSMRLCEILNNEGSTLVLRFIDKGNCINCIETLMQELSRVDRVLPNLNHSIIFITSVNNAKELFVLKEIYKIEYPLYNIGKTNILVPMESEINSSFYYLTVDNTCKILSFFQPIRKDESLTDLYLDHFSN